MISFFYEKLNAVRVTWGIEFDAFIRECNLINPLLSNPQFTWSILQSNFVFYIRHFENGMKELFHSVIFSGQSFCCSERDCLGGVLFVYQV